MYCVLYRLECAVPFFIARASFCMYIHVFNPAGTLSQCWLKAGSPSATVAQHEANIGSVSRVYLLERASGEA